MKAWIGPSILNADLSALSDNCVKLLDDGADYLHLDVMDGHFVPNLTFGHPVVKCLRDKLKAGPMFDVHMMVAEPKRWIGDMQKAGADQYTFHYEAAADAVEAEEICRSIREAGMRAGVGLKPGTKVQVVEELVEKDVADMVLIMTVEPGFGGQSFMEDMMPKVSHLRQKYPNLDIEVDGGVGPKTIEKCAEAGANMIVSGTAVVKSDNPKLVMDEMRAHVNRNILKRSS